MDEFAKLAAKTLENQGFSSIFPDNLQPNQVWQIQDLLKIVHAKIEDDFPPMWIGGEISNFTTASSGHIYFSLKDAQSQLRCTFFKPYQRGAMPMKNGQNIEAFGQLSIYSARGELQFKVFKTRAAGLGDAFARREALKQSLAKEGLFDLARKKTLPKFPRKIGIITSLQAAALRDVLKTLKLRCPQTPIVIYPAQVQGVDAPASISAAIGDAEAHAAVDVLLLCRGGGSAEDLIAFDHESVIRAVANANLPIISGIGHETDEPLVDLAADARAATPTAAAELASRHLAELPNIITEQQRQLQREFGRFFNSHQQQLEQLRQRLQIKQQHLFQLESRQLAQWQTRLNHAMQNQIQRQQQHIHSFQRQLTALSPLAVLARGFVCVMREHGEMIQDFSQVHIGDTVHLRSEHHQLIAKIININPNTEL